MTRDEITEGIAKFSPWFYEFDLGNGLKTHCALPDEVRPIHTTRLEMVSRVVDSFFGARLPNIRVFDTACHEGYFSVALAKKGLRHVTGMDVRKESIEKARFISAALGLKNISWAQANCEDLKMFSGERFELTLFLGVLYHLENPMLCLRNIAALTGELCLIETQVMAEVEGITEWGCKAWTRPYHGTLAFIDESGEFHDGNRETGATPFALCPSPKAVEFMLKAAGFKRVEIVPPPQNAYEQFARGKRMIFAAYK